MNNSIRRVPETAESSTIQIADLLLALHTRLDRIEDQLRSESQVGREYYSVSEAAALLHKAPFTVREWCRLQRINARKRPSGRGRSCEWMIPVREIQRIIDQGLLPRGL